MKRLLLLLIGFGLGVWLSGCTSSAGKQISQETFDQFVIGQSTKADVITKLGAPQSNYQTPGGETVMYMFVQAGLNGAAYVPVVNIFATKMSTTTSTVTFTFDKAGILRDTHRGNSAIESKTGLGTP